jgi:ribosomal protein S18 acetylase RimI-like enzyme
MTISNSISRLTSYYARYGFGATLRRGGLAVKRVLCSNRMVVFYHDLSMQAKAPVNIPNFLHMERLKSYAELSSRDLEDMTSFWNPEVAHQNIRERFEQGASLWLIKSGDRLAGYGWTLQGATIEPHYFPLAQDDVHFFDFHVFPQYRGNGVNPALVTHILRSVAAECSGRAYIEAAEWNKAQLASLGKTPFRRLGLGRKSRIFHRAIVCWAKNEPLQQVQKDAERRQRTSTTASSHQR